MATVHELQPRRLADRGPVPKFTEVSAPRKWNRLGASLLLHVAAILFLVRVAVWLPREAVQLVTQRHEAVTLIVPSLEKPVIVKPVPPPPPKLMAELREEPKLPTPPAPVITPKMETPRIVKPAPEPEAPRIAENTPPPSLPKPRIPEKKITQG